MINAPVQAESERLLVEIMPACRIRVPYGPKNVDRKIIEKIQRRRLSAGLAECIRVKGSLKRVVVADILSASGMGRRQFYSLFKNKQECFDYAVRIAIEDNER